MAASSDCGLCVCDCVTVSPFVSRSNIKYLLKKHASYYFFILLKMCSIVHFAARETRDLKKSGFHLLFSFFPVYAVINAAIVNLLMMVSMFQVMWTFVYFDDYIISFVFSIFDIHYLLAVDDHIHYLLDDYTHYLLLADHIQNLLGNCIHIVHHPRWMGFPTPHDSWVNRKWRKCFFLSFARVSLTSLHILKFCLPPSLD